MLRYAIRRLLTYIPLVMGLAVVVFFYAHVIPGDPVQAMVGNEASPELVQQIRHELRLDLPLHIQFIEWVKGLTRGDLGITFRSRRPITPLLLDRIPATIELALASLLVATLLGLPPGLMAGLRKNTRVDYFFSMLALSGLSMPVFWTGTLIMILFGLKLRILPSQGYVPFAEDPKQNLTLLIMPALALGIGMAPYIARMTRTAVIETMQGPFVSYARAKGLKGRTVFFRYIFRHAVCAIVVVLAMDIGLLLSGQILIEELFVWPGMGRLAVRAVIERDYFVMQACILLFAVVFLIANLMADLVQAWLDPRIQLK